MFREEVVSGNLMGGPAGVRTGQPEGNGVRVQFCLVPDRPDVQMDVGSTLLIAVIKQKSKGIFTGDDVTGVPLARKAVISMSK